MLGGDDVDVFNGKNVRGFPFIPYMGHGAHSKTHGGKVVSDAAMPAKYTTGRDWTPADFESSYPEELKKKVSDNWAKMGFREE